MRSTVFHREVHAHDSHLVFSPPVLIEINKKKFPQFRPCKASTPLLSLNISSLTISFCLSLRSALHR